MRVYLTWLSENEQSSADSSSGKQYGQVLEHSNACAGIPELPGITRNYPELGGIFYFYILSVLGGEQHTGHTHRQ